MALTGREDGPPLLAPPGLASAMATWAGEWHAVTGALGGAVAVDGPALLGERAALAGLDPPRSIAAAGGVTRLLRAADGWLAVALARPDDVASLAAWLGARRRADAVAGVAAAVRARPAGDAGGASAGVLGLPVRGARRTARDGTTVRR